MIKVQFSSAFLARASSAARAASVRARWEASAAAATFRHYGKARRKARRRAR